MSKKSYSTRGLTQSIREFIQKNPGARYAQIRAAMMRRFRFTSETENRISATLNQMFNHESLRRTGRAGTYTYYIRASR